MGARVVLGCGSRGMTLVPVGDDGLRRYSATGAMSTEVVVEIDEGCMRKARLAPAHSRELTQPRARKRDHAKETPGFGHGSGAEGWLLRAYRREVRKWLRDLWGLLVFAIWDFFTQTPLPGRTGRQVRVGRRRWYLPGRHTRRWGTRC